MEDGVWDELLLCVTMTLKYPLPRLSAAACGLEPDQSSFSRHGKLTWKNSVNPSFAIRINYHGK
jgi:hypothetical protein